MTSRNRHEGGIDLVQRYLQDGLIVINPTSPGCGQAASELIGYMGRPETRFTGPQGVVKKNDEFCDLTRYLVMHEPAWCERGPNPYSREFSTEHLQLDDPENPARQNESEDQRVHRERLEYSARMLSAMRKRTGPPSLAEGVLTFG
ncbi:MAG: hypothetical protein H0U59_13580 [Gemmatimonadaceae bacterium]|nr:hypothetical protein [Gemmatimonadaceae bacterium]